jgi:hypothetical protein
MAKSLQCKRGVADDDPLHDLFGIAHHQWWAFNVALSVLHFCRDVVPCASRPLRKYRRGQLGD